MLRYEILPGLPAFGPMALPFSWDANWPGHSEGLVVRFNPGTMEEWVGNFHHGFGGWDGILEHPDGKDLIVVARGQGYVVDPMSRLLKLFFPGSVEHVLSLPEFNAILFSDGLSFEAVNKDGLWWQSPRISWDGIRNIKIEGRILHGEAYTPIGDEWSPFTVDLMTGHCQDRVYDETRFQPVKRPDGL